MSQNLVVKTPHILLNADASAWANGAGITYNSQVQEATYADEAVVRRAAGVDDYGASIAVDAETSTHAASAALWPLKGTGVNMELRASDAVVGATNPQWNNVSGNTSTVIVQSVGINVQVGQNMGIDVGLAVDGSFERVEV